jgi:Ca2+-transporting ATPase
VVVVVSFAISEVSTGIIVGLPILLNVVLGSRQELKPRASVNALSNLQVPQAKGIRDGALALLPAPEVVPGDIVQVEAGDIVPADGRIIHSATLRGAGSGADRRERAGGKDAGVLPGPEVALGTGRTCSTGTRP